MRDKPKENGPRDASPYRRNLVGVTKDPDKYPLTVRTGTLSHGSLLLSVPKSIDDPTFAPIAKLAALTAKETLVGDIANHGCIPKVDKITKTVIAMVGHVDGHL